MRYIFPILILLFGISNALHCEGISDKTKKYTISGTIRDHSNGEALVGATIYMRETNSGTSTDIYGNYSLTVTGGKYTLIISYIGYKTKEKPIELDQNLHYNFELEPSQETLKEVEITSDRRDKNISRPEMSTFKMDIKTIQEIPSLMGEVDIIKAIQLLPGVQTVSEGTNGFSVRGGAPDQNLILLDDATV